MDEEFVKAHLAFGEGKEPNKTLGGLRGVPRGVHARARRELSGARAEDIVTAARWFGEKGRTAMSMWTHGAEPAHEGRLGEQPRPQPPPRHRQDWRPGLDAACRSPASRTPAAACATAARSRTCCPTAGSSRTRSTAPRWRSSGTCRPGTIRPENGLPTMDLFQALEEGKLKALYVMTTNPGQSLPNVDRYRKALEERGAFLVVAEAFHPTRTSRARRRGPARGALGGEGGRLRLHRAALPAARAGGEAGGRGAPRLRDPLRPRAAARAREAPALEEAGGGVGGDPDALQGDGVRLQRHEPRGAEGVARAPLAAARRRATPARSGAT